MLIFFKQSLYSLIFSLLDRNKIIITKNNTDITGNNDNGDSYVYARDYQILFRSFNISFKYKFGKVDFDPIKKKAKLINDDQMEDDGGDY